METEVEQCQSTGARPITVGLWWLWWWRRWRWRLSGGGGGVGGGLRLPTGPLLVAAASFNGGGSGHINSSLQPNRDSVPYADPGSAARSVQ